MILAFLFFRWRSKQIQQKREAAAPDGLPIPLYTDENLRPTYIVAAPPYQSERPLQATTAAVTDRHSIPSTLVSTLPPSSTAPGQSSVSGRVDTVQVQDTLAYTPAIERKARYMGNSQPSSIFSVSPPPSRVVPSPGDTEGAEAMLPAYSRH